MPLTLGVPPPFCADTELWADRALGLGGSKEGQLEAPVESFRNQAGTGVWRKYK